MIKESEVLNKLMQLDIVAVRDTTRTSAVSRYEYTLSNGSVIEYSATVYNDSYIIRTRKRNYVPFPTMNTIMVNYVKNLIAKWEMNKKLSDEQRVWKEFLND